MIDILVVRGDQPVDGPDVTDPLVSDMAAAHARGKFEIDRHSQTKPVQLKVVFRQGLRTGQLIEVLDGLQGLTWRGQITALDIAVEGQELTANLTVIKVLA